MLPAMPSLEELRFEIKKYRNKLGLSQKALSNLMEKEISQSFITKFERGMIDPTYSKLSNLIEVLRVEMTKKRVVQEVLVKEIMTKQITFIEKRDTVSKAVNVMLEKDFSQLPIKNDGKIVGSLSERTLIRQKIQYLGKKDFEDMPVGKIMDDPFPTVGGNTSVKVIRKLLMDFQAILVAEKGVEVGIISRADLLRQGSNHKRF